MNWLEYMIPFPLGNSRVTYTNSSKSIDGHFTEDHFGDAITLFKHLIDGACQASGQIGEGKLVFYVLENSTSARLWAVGGSIFNMKYGEHTYRSVHVSHLPVVDIMNIFILI